MRLVVRSPDADDRLALLPGLLETPWDIVVADPADRAAFSAALATADATVAMKWSASEPAAPRLKLLHLPGAGLDEIDFAAVPPTAVVCNAYGHEIGIAEYVLGAILNHLVGFQQLDAELRAGRWWGSHLCGPRHGDAFGKTLAIVGYGRIGKEVAKRASAFGMHVIAASRTPGPGDTYCSRVASMSELPAVAAQGDFVLCTLPLDATSRGVIGKAVFAAMKRSAVLINVGRGATVDEEALYDALKTGQIGGACIDTWYSYPAWTGSGVPVHRPSRFPFHELHNVVMTPHACAWTEALAERRCRLIGANLDRLARGEPLASVVRPALAPASSLALQKENTP